MAEKLTKEEIKEIKETQKAIKNSEYKKWTNLEELLIKNNGRNKTTNIHK